MKLECEIKLERGGGMLDNHSKMKFIQAASIFTYDLESFGLSLEQEKVKKYILSELNEMLELNEKDIMRERLDYFQISGTIISDYEQKLIKIEETNKSVLAGIRHMGGNPNKPFIYIWPDFVIKEEDIEIIIKNVYPYFKVFNPLYISFWINPNILSNHQSSKKLITVQQSFIGDMDILRSKDPITNKKELLLEEIHDDDYYKWYETEYRNFHKMKPQMKERIPLNKFELMEDCRKEGLLYYGTIDGERVGIIAGETNNLFGLEGIYINEIMIAKEYRGNRYSERLLKAFIDILPQSTQVLWCHIDSENIPSTKTAIHSGQEVFSIECFYYL